MLTLNTAGHRPPVTTRNCSEPGKDRKPIECNREDVKSMPIPLEPSKKSKAFDTQVNKLFPGQLFALFFQEFDDSLTVYTSIFFILSLDPIIYHFLFLFIKLVTKRR